MDILRAYKIACQLHAGQTDKAGRPYIEHLTRVLLRVQMDGGDRFQQIAALLHDSIEDEKTTAEELLALGVPSEAVVLVQALTKREEQSYEDYLRGLIGRYRVVTVKMADPGRQQRPRAPRAFARAAAHAPAGEIRPSLGYSSRRLSAKQPDHA